MSISVLKLFQIFATTQSNAGMMSEPPDLLGTPIRNRTFSYRFPFPRKVDDSNSE